MDPVSAGGGVELRHLRVLVAVAEAGTLTDAGIELHMSQPAVSRALAQFERLVGAELVHRTTRDLHLTVAGERVCVAARTALRAVAAVAVAAQGNPGPLRVGYAWAAFGRFTNAIVHRWRDSVPDVPIELHRIDERAAGLTHGASDIAVVRGGFSAPGITVQRVFTEARMIALPLGHPLADIEGLTLAHIAGEPLVHTPSIGTTRLDLWPAGSRPTKISTVGNLDEWLTAIAAGDAVGVTPAATAYQYPHPGVVYRPAVGAPAVGVNLAWPTTAPHPAVWSFVELVRRVAAAEN